MAARCRAAATVPAVVEAAFGGDRDQATAVAVGLSRVGGAVVRHGL
ncbi:hypothetical protein [Prauserella marina]|nr:hypothetical protein [Prauserella marina]